MRMGFSKRKNVAKSENGLTVFGFKCAILLFWRVKILRLTQFLNASSSIVAISLSFNLSSCSWGKPEQMSRSSFLILLIFMSRCVAVCGILRGMVVNVLPPSISSASEQSTISDSQSQSAGQSESCVSLYTWSVIL